MNRRGCMGCCHYAAVAQSRQHIMRVAGAAIAAPAVVHLPFFDEAQSDMRAPAAISCRGGRRLTRERTCLAIVLAAGEGTRMRSVRAKVLHAIGGQSLLAHVLEVVREAGDSRAAVVVGPGGEAVAAEARRVSAGSEVFVQAERCGTAHAVLAAQEAIARGPDDVLIVFGDTP